jgi:hypothetical protein
LRYERADRKEVVVGEASCLKEESIVDGRLVASEEEAARADCVLLLVVSEFLPVLSFLVRDLLKRK